MIRLVLLLTLVGKHSLLIARASTTKNICLMQWWAEYKSSSLDQDLSGRYTGIFSKKKKERYYSSSDLM